MLKFNDSLNCMCVCVCVCVCVLRAFRKRRKVHLRLFYQQCMEFCTFCRIFVEKVENVFTNETGSLLDKAD
jgi:ferredoxin-like protein FixX